MSSFENDSRVNWNRLMNAASSCQSSSTARLMVRGLVRARAAYPRANGHAKLDPDFPSSQLGALRAFEKFEFFSAFVLK